MVANGKSPSPRYITSGSDGPELPEVEPAPAPAPALPTLPSSDLGNGEPILFKPASRKN